MFNRIRLGVKVFKGLAQNSLSQACLQLSELTPSTQNEPEFISQQEMTHVEPISHKFELLPQKFSNFIMKEQQKTIESPSENFDDRPRAMRLTDFCKQVLDDNL